MTANKSYSGFTCLILLILGFLMIGALWAGLSYGCLYLMNFEHTAVAILAGFGGMVVVLCVGIAFCVILGQFLPDSLLKGSSHEHKTGIDIDC